LEHPLPFAHSDPTLLAAPQYTAAPRLFVSIPPGAAVGEIDQGNRLS